MSVVRSSKVPQGTLHGLEKEGLMRSPPVGSLGIRAVHQKRLVCSYIKVWERRETKGGSKAVWGAAVPVQWDTLCLHLGSPLATKATHWECGCKLLPGTRKTKLHVGTSGFLLGGRGGLG